MKEELKPNYYSVVPAEIKYDDELTEKAKLIYGEISSLSNKKGYCFATNSYFAKLYKCTNRTIQNAISKLQEKGFIKAVIENNNLRKIFVVTDIGYEENFVECENNFIGDEDNFTARYENNFTHNIINNNKMDRLFNYIINKKTQIPKEFEKCETQIIDIMNKFDMNYTEDILKIMKNENIEKVKIVCYSLAVLVKENLGHFLYKINRDKLFWLYDKCKIQEEKYKNTDNEIENFPNYFYKSLKNQLISDRKI